EAHIFEKRFSPIILLTTKRAGERRLKQLRTLADDVKICGETEIDFRFALRWLHHKWGVKRLLCEGGGELHSALLRAKLVDELHLTICPKVFGGRHAPSISDGAGAASLSKATRLELKSRKRVGDELFLIYRAVNSDS
ncbi:MAG: RibD family protein, partial [Verrucomicrobiota bacterium]